MHSPWDLLIGWMIVIYLIGSCASAPFLVEYAVWKIKAIIEKRRK